MDLNIEEVLSTYKRYIDGLNITTDGTSIHDELIKAKQIVHESQQLDKSWYDKKNLNKETHFRRMCELSEELHTLLNTKSLCEIWKRLSDLEFKPEESISLNEATWRKRDLSDDISHFYAHYGEDTRMYIKKFKYVIKLKTTTQYEITVKYFCRHVNNLVKIMNDLDERMSSLMNLINPSLRKKLIWTTPPHIQASMIAERLKIIAKRFELQFACDAEFEEFCRLNRRMFVLVKYSDFTELSERDEKRYAIIRRLSAFKVKYEGEDVLGDALVKVVEMMEYLIGDIDDYRHFALSRFMPQWMKVKQSSDYSSLENVQIMKKNYNVILKIQGFFLKFVNRFLEFRKLMDEIWNIL